MADKIAGIDPNRNNPNHPGDNEAPVDPSNTSSVGKKVEQGVVDLKKGISEQSSEWEDTQERDLQTPGASTKAENYLKNPSPEENNSQGE